MMYYQLNPAISQVKLFPNHVMLYCDVQGNKVPTAKINLSAYEILSLCNGENTKESIINILSKKYSDQERIKVFVNNYIEKSKKSSLILEKEVVTVKSTVEILDFTEKIIPELIALELTTNCPLSCQHCYLSAGSGKYVENSMKSSMLETICQEIVDLDVKTVQLTGGEPLLHKDIYKTIDFLQKNNIAVQLFTSGYLNSTDIINKLSNFNRKDFIVQVSIDGLAYFHNQFRGKSDAYSRSIDFIKQLVDKSIKVVVGISILNQSDHEMLELANVLKKIGVSVIRLGFVSERGRAVDNQLGTYSSGIERVKFLQNLLSEEIGDEKFKVELSEDFEKVNICGNCGLGQLLLKIDHRGDIYPCIMSDTKIGNYQETNINKIQEKCSKIFSKIKLPISEGCQNCSNFSSCKFCIIEALIYCSEEKEWYKENMPLIEKVRYV